MSLKTNFELIYFEKSVRDYFDRNLKFKNCKIGRLLYILAQWFLTGFDVSGSGVQRRLGKVYTLHTQRV